MTISKKYLKHLLPIIVYFGLSLLITWFLFKPGYIFSLDNAFTPHWTNQISSLFWGYSTPYYGGSIVLYGPLLLLNHIMPTEIIFKIFIFSIFFIAGINAHYMIRYKASFINYYSGFLYLFNPFVFIKTVTGSWGILAGYAFLPLIIRISVDYFEKISITKILLLLICMIFIGVDSHTAVIGILLFSIIFVFQLIRFGRYRWKTSIILYISAIVVFILVNLYWILPVITNTSAFPSLTTADIEYFAPETKYFNVYFSVLSMYGYWNISVQEIVSNSWCWVFFLPILFLVLTGVFCNYKIWWVQFSVIVFIFGFLLSLGVYGPLEPLFAKFHFMATFRETYKFIILLVIPYCVLGGLGLTNIYFGIKQTFNKPLLRWRQIPYIVCLIFLVLLLFTPIMYTYRLIGTNNQLVVSEFPDEWYEVDNILKNDKDDVSTLFLPWHQFMTYQWVGENNTSIISLGTFFSKNTIMSENLEIPGIYSQSSNPGQKYLDKLVSDGSFNSQGIGNKLAKLAIRYLIIAKELDYEKYLTPSVKNEFITLYEGKTILLLRNATSVSRLYEIVKDEYGGIVYKAVNLEMINPWKFNISNLSTSQKMLAFVTPNLDSRYWSGEENLENESQCPNIIRYLQTNKDLVIIYQRSYILAVGYLVTILTIVFFLSIFILDRMKLNRFKKIAQIFSKLEQLRY